MADKRNLLSNLLLALGSILVTLILVELLLVTLGPASLHQRRNENSYRSFIWNPENTVFDSELGYFNRPNLDVPFVNWDYKTRITTNSQGFRDDVESLDRPEILLLGGSFGFGWGVEDNENAEKVIEGQTGKKVINLCVARYGTVQQFLLLQRYCEVSNATGCTVVFLYYINDRVENRAPPGEALPTVRKEGRRILFTPASEDYYDAIMAVHQRTWITDLSYRSALLDLTVGTFFNPRTGRAFHGEFNPEQLEKKDHLFPGIAIPEFEVLEYLLRVLKVYASERNLDVKFVLLPFLGMFEDTGDIRDYTMEKKVFEMVGVPYQDVSKRFSAEDFHPEDRHLNAQGHQELGNAVAEYLIESATP